MTATPSAILVEAVVEDDRWSEALGDVQTLAEDCAAALTAEMETSEIHGTGAAVLFTDDLAVRDLNARFRNKDKPTNVLSFPSDGPDGHLGDVALAFGVVAAEAVVAKRTMRARTAHMIVHGLAHLLGFDHQEDGDAEVMERLEARALARLGFDDPYIEDDGH